MSWKALYGDKDGPRSRNKTTRALMEKAIGAPKASGTNDPHIAPDNYRLVR